VELTILEALGITADLVIDVSLSPVTGVRRLDASGQGGISNGSADNNQVITSNASFVLQAGANLGDTFVVDNLAAFGFTRIELTRRPG